MQFVELLYLLEKLMYFLIKYLTYLLIEKLMYFLIKYLIYLLLHKLLDFVVEKFLNLLINELMHVFIEKLNMLFAWLFRFGSNGTHRVVQKFQIISKNITETGECWWTEATTTRLTRLTRLTF